MSANPPEPDSAVVVEGRSDEIRWDDVDGTTIYIGWAYPGTATSVAQWKIARQTYTGDDWVFEWADNDWNYDNEWDERADLSY